MDSTTDTNLVRDIILQHAFPIVGIITGTFLSFAPFRDVLEASQQGHLGDMNPTPWVFMLGNCCGWLAYGFLMQNIYVFLSNAPGFLLAIWLNIQAIKITYENHYSEKKQNAIINAVESLDRSNDKELNKHEVTKIVRHVVIEEPPPVTMIGREQEGKNSSADYMTARTSSSSNDSSGDLENGYVRDNTLAESDQDATEYACSFTPPAIATASHECMLITICAVWLFLITLVIFSQTVWDKETRATIIGFAANANLVLWYAAPLSKLATVLETRSSSSIHIPTMITSVINGTLWCVYGIEVSDYFIGVPNGFGTALGVVQLFLCIIFPRNPWKNFGVGDGITMNAFSRNADSGLTEKSAPLI